MSARRATSLAAQLANDLADYDGRAVTILSEAEARHGAHPDYVDALCVLIAQEARLLQEAATWLIKARLEVHGAPTARDSARVCAAALVLARPDAPWQAVLHILQCAQALAPPAGQDGRDALVQIAQAHETHSRPFVRAWAMDALCACAQLDPKFAADAARALAQAEADPAASVRARARRWASGQK